MTMSLNRRFSSSDIREETLASACSREQASRLIKRITFNSQILVELAERSLFCTRWLQKPLLILGFGPLDLQGLAQALARINAAVV